jgi:hypothetical protein
VVRSEAVSSFDRSDGSPLSVNAAVAALAQMMIRSVAQSANRTPPGPEAQAALHAAQVVSATLDGDDSVRLVEFLLSGGKAEPPVARPFGGPGTSPDSDVRATDGGPAATAATSQQTPAAAPADAPAPWVGLVKWLAIPGGAALVAVGWLGWRAYRRRLEKPAQVA